VLHIVGTARSAWSKPGRASYDTKGEKVHKDVRKLIREVEANGFTVSYGARSQGRGHAKVLSSTGGVLASIPISPGRGRCEANLRAELRRKGILPDR
jgi:hypothetical protein